MTSISLSREWELDMEEESEANRDPFGRSTASGTSPPSYAGSASRPFRRRPFASSDHPHGRPVTGRIQAPLPG